jgi:hypothetical protein
VGNKNRLRPERLIGLVNEALDSGDAAIGRIDILRNMAFFELEAGAVDSLLAGSQGMDFEGVPIEIEKARGTAPKGGFPKDKTHKRKGQGKGKSFDQGKSQGRGQSRSQGKSKSYGQDKDDPFAKFKGKGRKQKKRK